MEEEKKYRKNKQTERDKNKQKESKHKNTRTTILLLLHATQQKKGHAHIKDAGEVESNNWAVKPPQV